MFLLTLALSALAAHAECPPTSIRHKDEESIRPPSGSPTNTSAAREFELDQQAGGESCQGEGLPY